MQTMLARFAPTLAVVQILTGLTIATSSPAARADDRAAIDELVALNKKAVGDFELLDWDAARRNLLDALKLAKKAGLDGHPIAARTYLHLGAVYVAGYRDRARGGQAFARALEIEPGIELSKAIATSEVKAAFAEAQRARGVEGAEGDPPASAPRARGPLIEGSTSPAPATRRRARGGEDDEPDLPLRIDALDCPNKDETILEKPVTVRCAVAAGLPVEKVFLLYREPGKGELTGVEMAKTAKGWYQAKIPGKAVTGKSLQFYFEGRNGAGKAVVLNGRPDSPNVMLIVEEGAEPLAGGSAGRRAGTELDENPLDEEGAPRSPRLYLGKVDRSKIGLDVRYGRRKWWVGVAVGSGYGYAKGTGLEARQDLQDNFAPGMGWASVGHLAPELGYQVTPDFALSIQTRHQWIPQPGPYARFTARGAHSAFAKALLYTKQARFRLFGSAMAGGGEGFRFTLYPDPDHPQFKDTVRGGPAVGGLGGGAYYEMTKALSVVLEVNALAGFPTFSAVADVNLGVHYNIY